MLGLSDSGAVLANTSTSSTTTSWIFSGTTWQTALIAFPVPGAGNAVGFGKTGSVIYADPDGLWVVSSAGYTNYGLPAGGGPISIGQVFVDRNGHMAGSTQTPFTTGTSKFLFGGTTTSGLTSLTTPGANSVVISGQNDNGQIIGNTNNPAQPSAPILYDNGRYIDLRSIVNFPVGSTQVTVLGLNDSNQICGGLVGTDGNWHAFLLTPV